ncbi:OSBL9 protein, partial [Corythaeola cristata]|nr:OSBL9 protein [Corythaeola cristata]
RSILTVPWIELGGECSINCSKTGYNASIVFHTKPFYGGKKHRITAEIFSPNDKKPFCSIEGEWNGVMYAKYTTGVKQLFFLLFAFHQKWKIVLKWYTKKMPTIKKKVRKLEDQEDFESRCLWKDVTYNLKIRDIDAATAAKH